MEERCLKLLYLEQESQNGFVRHTVIKLCSPLKVNAAGCQLPQDSPRGPRAKWEAEGSQYLLRPRMKETKGKHGMIVCGSVRKTSLSSKH